MDETTLDLYVDTEASLTGTYNNFDVILPMPVIVNDDEKCYVRLKDFTMLNSCYNISNDLQNNTLGIIQTNRIYSRSPSGTAVAYFNDTDLFNTSGTYVDYPITNPAWNGTLHTETIIPSVGDYTILLYDPTITTTYANAPITSVKLRNIFRPTIGTNFTTFNPDDYLVFFNKTNPTSGRFISQLTFSIENVASVINNPTEPVYITFNVWSSIDGITWVENAVSLGDSPSIGYATTEWTYTTTRTRTITLISTTDDLYHKVSFETQGFATPATDFKSKIKVKQIYLTRIPSYTESYTDGITTFTHTIEDGSYSLTNLNSYLNYLLRLYISPNLAFSMAYPSQPFLTAQNKQVLAWGTAEPDYVYSSADRIDNNYKIEINFNATLRRMLGWSENPVIFKNDTPIEAPRYLNLINFKKIMLTSSLQLKTKPYTFLNKTYTKATGVGDVIAWISKDIAPFTYINWYNNTDSKIEIANKLITKINFVILNEFCQVLSDIPSCCFHIQIVKIKNVL